MEKPQDFSLRTEDYAVAVVKLFDVLPRGTAAQTIGKQLLRAGTSVGAHYAEARHARSTAEFVSKIDGGRQEMQETLYWLRLVGRLGYAGSDRLAPLVEEGQEIRAILMAMAANAGNRKGNSKPEE